MKSLPLLLVVLALGSGLAGCSESVMIRSEPAGAKGYVNNDLVGRTPFVFSVKRRDLQRSYSLRLEKDGYEPYTETLHTRFAGGRATGAFFTLGIVYLFKSPWYLVPPPIVTMQPSQQAERDRRLGQDLRELQQLRSEGKITQQQFEQRRRDLLEEK
jgi:PEGA domain